MDNFIWDNNYSPWIIYNLPIKIIFLWTLRFHLRFLLHCKVNIYFFIFTFMKYDIKIKLFCHGNPHFMYLYRVKKNCFYPKTILFFSKVVYKENIQLKFKLCDWKNSLCFIIICKKWNSSQWKKKNKNCLNSYRIYII